MLFFVTVVRRVEFTYEVEWTETTIAFEDRFDRYLEDEYVAAVGNVATRRRRKRMLTPL